MAEVLPECQTSLRRRVEEQTSTQSLCKPTTNQSRQIHAPSLSCLGRFRPLRHHILRRTQKSPTEHLRPSDPLCPRSHSSPLEVLHVQERTRSPLPPYSTQASTAHRPTFPRRKGYSDDKVASMCSSGDSRNPRGEFPGVEELQARSGLEDAPDDWMPLCPRCSRKANNHTLGEDSTRPRARPPPARPPHACGTPGRGRLRQGQSHNTRRLDLAARCRKIQNPMHVQPRRPGRGPPGARSKMQPLPCGSG